MPSGGDPRGRDVAHVPGRGVEGDHDATGRRRVGGRRARGARPGREGYPDHRGSAPPPAEGVSGPMPGMELSGPDEPAYAGVAGTFSKLPLVLDPADLAGVDVAIVGAPIDETVTARPGARFGPRAIRL